MDTLFMNSENGKSSHPLRSLLDPTDKIDKQKR